MSNKFLLPMLEGSVRALPTVETMRSRLGGRAESEPGIGQVVRFEPAPGKPMVGVTIFAEADEVHVLLESGAVRRTKRELLSATEPADEEQAALAADIRVYSRLREGEAVRYLNSAGNFLDAKLVEKCRYGALVLRPDGALLAVGFRKLWPREEGDKQ